MLNDVKDTQQTNAINKSNVTDLVQSTKLEVIMNAQNYISQTKT